MKRITLFAGHYGSGKTNIALNYARMLKKAGETVAIADLDIVNPYFRTKDSAADLQAEGIDLIVSDFANSNVDFPAMPKEIYALVAPPEVGAECPTPRANLFHTTASDYDILSLFSGIEPRGNGGTKGNR